MPEESTTPDLEELLGRCIEAANRRDFDAATATFSKGAVWDRSRVGQEVIEGRDAIREFIEDWNTVFEEYVLGLEEFNALRNGIALCRLSQRGRPRGGGGLIEEPYAAVVAWKESLIVRVAVYSDTDQARAAAERLAQEWE